MSNADFMPRQAAFWVACLLLLCSGFCYAVQVPDSQHITRHYPMRTFQELADTEQYPRIEYKITGGQLAKQVQPDTTLQKLAAVQQLVQWLLANHAEVHVAVREAGPGAGLGLFAAQDIHAGHTILSLPTDLAFRRKTPHGVMDFLLDYAMDMANPQSPHALMWATVPRPHELRHLLNFPPSYLPLLQHPQLEEWVDHGLHHDLILFYRLHAEVLAAADISYDDVVHVMGLLGTRIFNKPGRPGEAPTYYALPLIDMANHDNACPHYNTFKPCEFDNTRECVYLTAGADIAAGQQVCFFYGYLLQDRSLLEYGFLQQQPNGATPELFGIDRHDADFETEPLAKLVAAPPQFRGQTRQETTARISQLQQLLLHLRSGNTVAAAIEAQGPASTDVGGYFLRQLLLWRQERQQAVAAEIARLQLQL